MDAEFKAEMALLVVGGAVARGRFVHNIVGRG